jgi:hypothetical protein
MGNPDAVEEGLGGHLVAAKASNIPSHNLSIFGERDKLE